MGRLFWKFFFFIWLAQLTAVFGISGVFWLKDRNQRNQLSMLDGTPPATMQIQDTALVLLYGGEPALRARLERPSRHPIYAVNKEGRELLGRQVPMELLQSARAAAAENRGYAQQVSRASESSYLLFIPRPATLMAGPGMAPPPEANGMSFDDRPPPPGGAFLPVIPLTIALLASLIFAILLAWYISKPIRTLRTAFDRAAHGELGVRIANQMGGRRDELADLGRDFDHMAGQLQSLMEGQRRLLHDVSHEMRSPLARLQVAIGLARQQPDRIDDSMARIERESERMDTLVGELLALSRLEAGVGRPETEWVPLHLLLADVAEDARFEAEASQRRIEFVPCPACTLQGQPELLQRALENIVRNAIRFTPEHTAVRIETALTVGRDKLLIRVLDQGPGVDKNELETIFEPFRRGDNPTGSGYGLGLAIARRVIETHHGSIRASNLPNGGFCMEVILPVQMA